MRSAVAMVAFELTIVLLLLTLTLTAACGHEPAAAPPTDTKPVPQSLAMGGAKSVMTFFVTSTTPGKGGDLGGLSGADAYCAALATAEGAGDHTWRAYLSTSARDGQPAVNARDRIGKGPWYNAEGLLIAANLDELHSRESRITKETAVTEKLDSVDLHDMLTGSRPDGTAYGEDLTCGNWTSSGDGRAQVGHHDRRGPGGSIDSWNSVHASQGCSQKAFRATGGAGLFYCFGVD
jgi:hypothetical protein